ncbi:short-chain dehydrogenase reductase sdr [Diplodia corticola]|uniref:Short-chain dehydrogenase reductase sdr n=1 Tax=Diplodia corticola TaxID=236234 RepID=A0A1J9RWT2_9PEZI|nr:short-chain dehydrogenase reductase sdr [Diplodia corticola]OJD37099.1 short-chain dehydrogenase reductase sdr [Diplodia corticola]
MHEAIILANWPSCLNSLVWSHDCILALAAGETVELLIPVLSADSNDVDTGLQGTQHWINVHIRTNLFSSTEVPPIDPLPLRANSIGEEISTSDTACIEWSPPGLAKHARCALAVLTTNLNLSLWVSDSDPKVTRGWRRALVLNHELDRYFQQVYAQEEIRVELEWETQRRLRRRIRSFAWSPQPRPSQPAEYSVQEAQFPINGSFIAVSNDDNDVVILRVDSPYSFYSPPSAQWSARAEAHFSFEPKIDLRRTPRPFLLIEAMGEQRYIGNLAWSPWTTNSHGVPEAILAYTTNHSVHLRRIRISPFSSDVSLDQTDIFSDATVGTREVHLLRWMPRAHGDVFYLVAFSQAGAFCFEVPCRDPSKTTVSTHDLDKRWDTVAGCAFNGLSKTEPRVQFLSQLSAPVVATSELKLPIPPTTESRTPPFQQSIRDSEKLFSAENELAGHTHTKAWAMCSSPMGDLVASGVSFHPGDMVEYTIAATSRTHIGIQPFEDTAGAFILPASGGLCPVEDLSAETLIYCAQTWLEELPEESRAERSVRNTILEQFWRALGLSNHHDDSLVDKYPETHADGLDLGERTLLAQTLRRAVYSNDKGILKQRYGRLLTLFFDPKGTTQSDDAPAIQKLVTEVLKVPRWSYHDSEASQKIRTVYSSMLPWLSDAEASGMYDGAGETLIDKHVERCEICDDSIGFESFAWARCGQGHEFVRCSLTFLAIQAPGISKLCGICGKRYLNEESVVRTDKLAGADKSQQDLAMPNVDGGQQGDILPSAETNVTAGEGSAKQGDGTGQGKAATADCERWPITLARIVFAACDVCIYCGGKFVG